MNGDRYCFQDGVHRVAKGAAYMDATHPGWERKIDLSTLDISDADFCICGQALGGALGYLDERAILGAQGKSAWEHGFVSSYDGDAWVLLIKERFDSGLLSDMATGA